MCIAELGEYPAIDTKQDGARPDLALRNLELVASADSPGVNAVGASCCFIEEPSSLLLHACDKIRRQCVSPLHQVNSGDQVSLMLPLGLLLESADPIHGAALSRGETLLFE